MSETGKDAEIIEQERIKSINRGAWLTGDTPRPINEDIRFPSAYGTSEKGFPKVLRSLKKLIGFVPPSKEKKQE